jgi:hypothetical protein
MVVCKQQKINSECVQNSLQISVTSHTKLKRKALYSWYSHNVPSTLFEILQEGRSTKKILICFKVLTNFHVILASLDQELMTWMKYVVRMKERKVKIFIYTT